MWELICSAAAPPNGDCSIPCQDAFRYPEFRCSFRGERGALRASVDRCGDFAAVEVDRKVRERAGHPDRFERRVRSRPIGGIAGPLPVQHYSALRHIEIKIEPTQTVYAEKTIGR